MGATVTDYTLLAFAAGVGVGAALRAALAERRPASKRGMRLVRHDYTAPAMIAAVPPAGHDSQCRLWTYRFIAFAETVAHERGKPSGRLPSYAEMARAAGTTWRPFEWYLDVLRAGGVVDVRGRGGAWWALGRGSRRAALDSLPYPASRPPRFPFAA